MRRLALLIVLVGSLCTGAVEAQQRGRVHRIGYVSPATPPQEPSPAWAAFLDGLRDQGFIEGTNLVTERRYAAGQGAGRVQELLAELVALKVDVIVTQTTSVALEAKKSIRHVPIVMAASTDPVGGGVVESLARPGVNITGFSFTSPELTGKRLEFLKAIAPRTTTVVMLVPTDLPVYQLHRRQAEAAAPALGIRDVTLEPMGTDPANWEAAFVRIARPDRGLVVTDSPQFFRHRQALVELAARFRMPVVYDLRQYVGTGGLLSYGPDVVDVYRRTGVLAGRILKGAQAAEIPIEQPTKFDLAINAKAARDLGLAIPPALRLRADQIVE